MNKNNVFRIKAMIKNNYFIYLVYITSNFNKNKMKLSNQKKINKNNI